MTPFEKLGAFRGAAKSWVSGLQAKASPHLQITPVFHVSQLKRVVGSQHTSATILDQEFELVPSGVIGEIAGSLLQE